MPDPASYARWLWLFTALFFLRVVGQIVVVLFHPRWLPSMPQWYSGLMPYRYLLPAQILILALMTAINLDFSAGPGLFVEPRPALGRWLVGFSFIYWGGMALRYVLRMTRHPDQRWLGGTIPIVFHCILAAYLFTFGKYHVG